MAKIQTIGVGNYIRNPKGIRGVNSRQSNVEILKIYANNGNSFLCYPVKSVQSTRVILDTSQYYQIPIDTNVEQATP